MALTARSRPPERIAADRAIDAGGLVPDLDPANSWSHRVDEVDPVELLEVQLCNMTAAVHPGGPPAPVHWRRHRPGAPMW